MKQLSTLRYLLLVLLFATASACGDDKKKEDPIPQNKFRISVRVITQGMQALAPAVTINSEYDFAGVRGNYRQGPVINDTHSGSSSDKTYDMGMFGDYDLVEVTLKRSGPPTGTAFMRARILVDGVEAASVTMDAANPNANYVAIETDNL